MGQVAWVHLKMVTMEPMVVIIDMHISITMVALQVTIEIYIHRI